MNDYGVGCPRFSPPLSPPPLSPIASLSTTVTGARQLRTNHISFPPFLLFLPLSLLPSYFGQRQLTLSYSHAAPVLPHNTFLSLFFLFTDIITDIITVRPADTGQTLDRMWEELPFSVMAQPGRDTTRWTTMLVSLGYNPTWNIFSLSHHHLVWYNYPLVLGRCWC